ncbi:MAG: amidohydrolase family protein, partial [Vicinamibacterales bacterium]|nr:amidohydrolase family protein [Vicinamibacterales bacterium]
MRQAIPVFLGLAGIAIMISACGAPPDYDVIIRGGSVLDGTGAPALVTDVGIRGDAIATVGDLSASTAAETIDAAGLTVTPGFIDMHSHSDFTLLVDPRALSKVMQGVTTELL